MAIGERTSRPVVTLRAAVARLTFPGVVGRFGDRDVSPIRRGCGAVDANGAELSLGDDVVLVAGERRGSSGRVVGWDALQALQIVVRADERGPLDVLLVSPSLVRLRLSSC